MAKAKLTIAYDGTDFHGSQKQDGLRTVQGELERVLHAGFGVEMQTFPSSRTDAGVHALGQVVHVEIDERIRVPLEQWDYMLRYRMPRDLMVAEVVRVPDTFHARHDARWKQYRYTISTARHPSIFEARFAAQIHYPLDVTVMQEAAKVLLGEHDFSSFCAARAQQVNKVRTLRSIQVRDYDDRIVVDIEGNGFLQNMVRIIVGTLIGMGRGHIPVGRMSAILDAQDRRMAGPTAPPGGLCLLHIEY